MCDRPMTQKWLAQKCAIDLWGRRKILVLLSGLNRRSIWCTILWLVSDILRRANLGNHSVWAFLSLYLSASVAVLAFFVINISSCGGWPVTTDLLVTHEHRLGITSSNSSDWIPFEFVLRHLVLWQNQLIPEHELWSSLNLNLNDWWPYIANHPSYLAKMLSLPTDRQGCHPVFCESISWLLCFAELSSCNLHRHTVTLLISRAVIFVSREHF